MKKFEIIENIREIKTLKDVHEGCTTESTDQYPNTIASFETLEEAREELKKYQSEACYCQGFACGFYKVTEYYIEENEYNDDGEWIGGGDIWDFAESNFNELY